MRLFAVLVLAGAVAAFSIRDYGEPEQEIKYKFVSQVLTGIPQLRSQYSGFRLTGVSIIQPDNLKSFRMKLTNMKYLSVNDELEVSDEREILSPQEQELPSQVKQQLEAPFKVSFTPSGQVEAIYTESTEPQIITNIKKSLINVNFDWLQGSRMIDTNQIHRHVTTDREPKASFKVMEKNMEGECEVEYSVNKMADYQIREFEQSEATSSGSSYCQDKDYYQVVKSVNYQNCKERPIYQRSVGSDSSSDGSSGASSPYLTESSVSRTIWCGPLTDPVVRKQTTEQKVVVSGNGKFDSQEKIEVTSRVTNWLISCSSKTSDIPEPQSPKKSHDLTFSYPTGDFWSSSSSGRSEHHLPQPSDMTSAPTNPYPTQSSADAKSRFVSQFVWMLESSRQELDLHSVTGHLSYLSTMLSYQDIQDSWTEIHQRLSHDIAVKENALNVFCDIISLGMAPTNPSIKFISEKIKNKQIKGESAAWIAANMIRSAQTPTEETIQELTNLLKHSTVQHNRDLKATVAMSLTEMIFKACVDETSSRYNYPTRVYGKFCSQSSKVIKKDLIPYLKQSLTDLKSELRDSEPSTGTMNKLITLINSLGNLGIEEASQALLEVVEGRYTQHPHPRSVAVYKLIRSAQQNPTKYRPVILTIINNNAEHEEVRMAAVTVMPYVQPTSSELQKLAVLTWFDSQQQVSSYISSTLKSLSELPAGSEHSLSRLSQKAGEAVKLSRPAQSGIHKSHNIEIKQFIESLKASVGLRLQYVNSEESAFPRTMYVESKISSKAQTMNPFQTSVYLQGADTVLDKLYDAYKVITQLSRPDRPEEKLSYQPRQTVKPEAHVTLKMFDMQRLFSVDSQYLQQVVKEVAKEMARGSGAIKRDQMKVLDIIYQQSILPTVTGLPLYYHHRVPMVLSAHTSVTTGRSGALEVKTKPMINYQQRTRVGTLCPFTQQYRGAGVETSLNVTVPLRTEVSIQNGQLSLTLKTPGDSDSQKDKPVVQFTVHPYTFNEDVFKLDQSASKHQRKTIHSRDSKHERQYDVGRPLGLDLKLKVDSEHQWTDLSSMIQDVTQHQPLTLLSLPLPLRSCRYHQVSLRYSPSQSQTKEASFIFSLGYGSKQSLFGQPKMHFPPENQSERRECEQEVSEDKWRQEPEEEDSQDEEEEKNFWTEHSKDSYRQKLKQKLDKERRVYECMKVKKCEEEKSQCESQLRGENRPRDEIEKQCRQKKTWCIQQTKTSIATKSVLYKLSSGTALTCSAALVLSTDNQQRKAEIRTSVGHSSGRDSRTKVQITASLDQSSGSSSQPYQVTFTSSSHVDQPRSKWNKMSIMEEELSGQTDMTLNYGERNQPRQTATATIKLSQSSDQKQYAVQSRETRECNKQTQQGKTLSEQCKEARRQSSSLDTIQTILSLPRSLSQNRLIKTLSQLSQAYVAPYIRNIKYHQQQKTPGDNQYITTINIHPQGQRFSVNFKSKETDIEMKDIRVVEGLQGLLPFNLQDSGSKNIIQKLTSRQAPSTCSLEPGTVKTFDNLEYDYELNDCEHVVFKDCSESSRVEVTVQKKSSSQTVKVTIDNHQYSLDIPRSRGSKAVITVNGEEKSYISREHHQKRKELEQDKQSRNQQQSEEEENRQSEREQGEFTEQKENYYQDQGTYVTSYEDGVFGVISKPYGISVYSDGRSVEVQTYQHLLRNKACGLCGDLNDERVADVKSPGTCIMSSPSLAAITYMVRDKSCRAPSQQAQDKIRQETEQCVKKQTIPTQVSQIYNQHQSVYSKHLVEIRDNKICFSTKQVTVCPSTSNPQKITEKKVSFYCLSQDSRSQRLRKMAEQGEFIPHQQNRDPTSYTRYISQPEQC